MVSGHWLLNVCFRLVSCCYLAGLATAADRHKWTFSNGFSCVRQRRTATVAGPQNRTMPYREYSGLAAARRRSHCWFQTSFAIRPRYRRSPRHYFQPTCPLLRRISVGRTPSLNTMAQRLPISSSSRTPELSRGWMNSCPHQRPSAAHNPGPKVGLNWTNFCGPSSGLVALPAMTAETVRLIICPNCMVSAIYSLTCGLRSLS